MEYGVTHEPTGKEAGRVTMTGAFVSLIPPVVTVILVAACFLVGILPAEIAMAVILGVLVNAGLTTGTVFQTQKHTPTDQVRERTVLKTIEAPMTEPTTGHDIGMVPDVHVEPEPETEATGGSHTAEPSAATLRAELAAQK